MSSPRLRADIPSILLSIMIAGCASSGDGDAAGSSSMTTGSASLATTDASSSGGPQPSTTIGTETADTSTSADAPDTTDGGSEGPPPPVDCADAMLPAWLDGRATNEWFEIPDTSGAGGAAVNAYSGFALRDSTTEIVIAAAGGHGDSADNRVVTLALGDDAPTWTLRHASSTETPQDVAYYPDGLPSARHIYQSAHVVDSLDRVFLVGARFVYGSAVSFPTVDAFDLSTNLWDAQGSWPDVPEGGSFGAVTLRTTEDVLTSTLFAWRATDASWSQPIGTHIDVPVRWPLAHDTQRDRLLTLQWGDGQGYDGPAVHATQVDITAGVQSLVTLAPGDGLTAFEAEAPTYAAMDYDPDNDRFLFYSGQASAAGRVYVVEASDEDTRSIDLLELGAASIAPPPSPGSGVNNRFRYVPGLCGFVLLADAASNLQFLRTAS
jgi:hypothetical protein